MRGISLGYFNEQTTKGAGTTRTEQLIVICTPSSYTGKYTEFAAAHPDGARATRQGRSLGGEEIEIHF